MDKSKAKDVRKVLNKILKENEDSLKNTGVSFKIGNASYNMNTITFKIDFVDLDEDGKSKPKIEYDFEKKCSKYNLKKSDLHKKIKDYNGKEYRIVGLNSRAHKYPIVVENSKGKLYKMSAQRVSELLLMV